MWTVDIVCFSGAAMEFLKCFVDERFINKAQFDAGFAHRLILKDGAVPAIKDPGHDSELQMVSETLFEMLFTFSYLAEAFIQSNNRSNQKQSKPTKEK